MAHVVRAKLHTKVIAHKDLEISVRTSADGKLGTLLVSKGNVEWLKRQLGQPMVAVLAQIGRVDGKSGKRVKKR